MSTIICIVFAFLIGLIYGIKRTRRKLSPQQYCSTPTTFSDAGNAQPTIGQSTQSVVVSKIPLSIMNVVKEEKHSKNTVIKENHARETSPQNDYHSDEAFQEKFGGNLPHCNGFKCNPAEQCNIYERRFCQTVLFKWRPNPGVDWIGQHWVNLRGEWRRVDFAIAIAKKEDSPRALAVEFDGYGSHVHLTREEFQEHLERQNNLYMSGWGILRFSYRDLKSEYRPDDYCRNMISGAVNAGNSMCSAIFSLPLYFADVALHDEYPENEKPKAFWSKRLRKLYIPVFDESNLSAFARYDVWAPCPRPECPGRIFRDEKSEKHYWRCRTCNKIFFDNGKLRPNKECTPNKNKMA